MEEKDTAFLLRLGREQLRFVGLDRLQLMRHRWEEKRHSNAQWELHLVLEGRCRVDLEDRCCEMAAGQILLIPPGQYHRPKTKAGVFERLSLAFSLEEGVLSRQLHQRCAGSAILELQSPMLQLARQILREHMTVQIFHQTCLEAMVTQFVIELFRQLQLSEYTVSAAKKDGSRITNVVDTYFEQHFADSAGEQVLAELLHVSRRQLVRILQEHYGMSFRQKLLCTRMDYAAWLLRTTDSPVSNICDRVGYSSEAAFFKTFRQHFGSTPNRYRKLRKSAQIKEQGNV